MGRHLVALGVLLAVAWGTSERSTGFSVDEGSYAIQAEALGAGAWAIDWPFRDVDPAGEHFPYHAGVLTVGPSEEFAYVGHPAWPWLLDRFDGIGGQELGIRLLSLASVLGAAATAWALARRIEGVAVAPWAFWIVGTSPVLPNGFMAWAHAPSIALAGLAVLSAAAIGAGPARWWWWIALPAACGSGVALRSEGLFAALAIGGVIGLAGLLRRDRRLIGAGLLAGTATATAMVLDWVWRAGITGDDTSTLSSHAGGGGWLAGRLEGATVALLKVADDPAGALCGILALALVGGALLLSRREGPGVRPALLVALAAGLMAVQLVVADGEPVSGLLPAWPVALFAVGALAVGPGQGLARWIGLGAGAFALAVLLSQYDDGGGLQWGGRYLSPLVVPVGTLAAMGVVRALPSVADRRGVSILLAATGVLGLVVTDEVRQVNDRAVDAVERTGEPVVLVAGDQLARLDWRAWPGRCWVADGDDLLGALELLRGAGVEHAAYLGIRPERLRAEGVEVHADPVLPVVGTIDLGPLRTEHAFAGCQGPVA